MSLYASASLLKALIIMYTLNKETIDLMYTLKKETLIIMYT